VHGGLKKTCYIYEIGAKCTVDISVQGGLKKSCCIGEIIGKCRYFGAWWITKELLHK
jgi:hypothetical protein